MDDVGDEVDVALAAAAPSVDAERLLHGEAQEQQLDVVHVELVRGLPLPRALLEVSVVSAKQQGTFPELLLPQHGPGSQQGWHREALKQEQLTQRQPLLPWINLPKGRLSAHPGKSNSICRYLSTHQYCFPMARTWDIAPWLKYFQGITTPDCTESQSGLGWEG